MSRIGMTLALLASSVLASACTDDLPTTPSDPTQETGNTSGSAGATFDHDNTDQISPWDLLQRLEQQGPPEYTAHVHGCQKVRYLTLGNILAEIGTDMTSSGSASAGALYDGGANALGGPDYSNRIRENLAISTSGMSREFDIFAAAAPSVIAAFAANTDTTAPTVAQCPGVQLFDGNGQCLVDGISCLIGYPATPSHVASCNLTISQSSSVQIGEPLAVAVMLAAAYTCE